MDDFRTIYRILKALHSQMDDDEPNPEAVSAEVLGVTQARRDSIMAMLAAEGYVSGVSVSYYDNARAVVVRDPRLTLRGLEYLQDNSLMSKAARAAKGIRDVLPL